MIVAHWAETTVTHWRPGSPRRQFCPLSDDHSLSISWGRQSSLPQNPTPALLPATAKPLSQQTDKLTPRGTFDQTAPTNMGPHRPEYVGQQRNNSGLCGLFIWRFNIEGPKIKIKCRQRGGVRFLRRGQRAPAPPPPAIYNGSGSDMRSPAGSGHKRTEEPRKRLKLWGGEKIPLLQYFYGVDRLVFRLVAQYLSWHLLGWLQVSTSVRWIFNDQLFSICLIVNSTLNYNYLLCNIKYI